MPLKAVLPVSPSTVQLSPLSISPTGSPSKGSTFKFSSSSPQNKGKALYYLCYLSSIIICSVRMYLSSSARNQCNIGSPSRSPSSKFLSPLNSPTKSLSPVDSVYGYGSDTSSLSGSEQLESPSSPDYADYKYLPHLPGDI